MYLSVVRRVFVGYNTDGRNGFMLEYTKKMAEDDLNGLEPPEHMKQSKGGPCPDGAPWGTWLRENDSAEFESQWKELAAEDKRYFDGMMGK